MLTYDHARTDAQCQTTKLKPPVVYPFQDGRCSSQDTGGFSFSTEEAELGFTKLDEKILQSSIMAEDPSTFKVWITMLASCERNGIAYVSPVYLSTICHLSIKRIRKAIEKLEAPDENSRSTSDDGRRIRRVDGGYEIINYLIYRDLSLKDAEAERKRLYRMEKRDCPDSLGRSPDSSASASASKSASISFKEGVWGGITENDMEAWCNAYPACGVQIELNRMAEWLKANPTKKKSNYRRFIINWLSRTQDRGGTKMGDKPSTSQDSISGREAMNEIIKARFYARKAKEGETNDV